MERGRGKGKKERGRENIKKRRRIKREKGKERKKKKERKRAGKRGLPGLCSVHLTRENSRRPSPRSAILQISTICRKSANKLLLKSQQWSKNRCVCCLFG